MILPDNSDVDIQDKSSIDEADGKLASDNSEDKLLRSVLENDSSSIDEGKVINEAFNNGVSSFTPDIMFKNVVKGYSTAERVYGEKLISLLSGYDPNYIKKNIKIPEFQREFKRALESNIKNLKKDKIIDNQGYITSEGAYLASLVLYAEELDHILPKGMLGKKEHKKDKLYGEKDYPRNYRKHDRYRDIDLKKSIKSALMRGHTSIAKEDLKVSDRKAKGSIEMIYAIDASGSMKGPKIETAKKAGIALAYNAIENKDKAGLIVFGTDVRDDLAPTLDFPSFLSKLTTVTASFETNISMTIDHAIKLFSNTKATRHLLIITDGMPTIGSDPENDALKAISKATSIGITTSIVGIRLNDEGKDFAKRAVEISKGKLYMVDDLGEVDKIVLYDYHMFS